MVPGIEPAAGQALAAGEAVRARRARAAGLGMNAELILLNFYFHPMNNPRAWTPRRERAWLRYVIARYAAFPNVFLWTIANEYETHPDGKYRLGRKLAIDARRERIADDREANALLTREYRAGFEVPERA